MVGRRIPAGAGQDFERWAPPSVARGQVLKAEAARAGRRSGAEAGAARKVETESFEQQVEANIRAGRYAAGVSASQLESIVRGALREGRAEGYAEGLAKGEREGHAQGLEAGLAAGRAIIEDQARRFASLVDSLQQPLASQQEELQQAMLGLIERIARAVVRSELAIRPESILAVVSEALAALPLGAAAVRVFVAPADLAIVRESIGPGRDVAIEADPAMSPGDCRIETRESVVQYAVSDRLGQMLGQLLGAGESGMAKP
jgi:flagellar assembly protein FliH